MLVNPVFQSVPNFGRIPDAPTFLKSIRELGITHLLYHSIDSHDCIANPAKEFLDKCIFELPEGGKITQLKQIGPFIIYSIVGSDDA